MPSNATKNSDTHSTASAELQGPRIDPNRPGIPKHLRAAYSAYYTRHCQRVMALSVLNIMAAFTLVLPMDWFFFPNEFAEVLGIRLGVVLPCGLLTLAILRDKEKKLAFKQQAASFYVVLCSALVGLLIARSSDPQAAGYLIGNFILLFFALTFMALPVYLMTLIAVSIFLIQTLTVELGPAIPSFLEIHVIIATFAFVPLACFAYWQLERDRRRQFLMVERERIFNRQIADQRDVLARLAAIDPLTGLANRRGFNAAWAGDIERADADALLAVAMIDIDNFKAYNDFYGHNAGDEALKAVAIALGDAVGALGRVGRLGGEEFVVAFVGVEYSTVIYCVERVRTDVEQRAIPHEGGNVAQVVTISIGLSIAGAGGQNASGLLEAADQALYQAKTDGRNRIVINKNLALVDAG